MNLDYLFKGVVILTCVIWSFVTISSYFGTLVSYCGQV